MAVYEIGLRTSVVTTASAGYELRGSTRRLQVFQIGITLQAATASTFGIGRPANTPAGGTNNVAPPGDPADAATGASNILAGWSTAPTAPATFFRRIGFPATIGSGIIFTFRQLILPISGSLVLWNLSAVGVSDLFIIFEEQ
jgi:hypothetical protein